MQHSKEKEDFPMSVYCRLPAHRQPPCLARIAHAACGRCIHAHHVLHGVLPLDQSFQEGLGKERGQGTLSGLAGEHMLGAPCGAPEQETCLLRPQGGTCFRIVLCPQTSITTV